MRRCRRAVCVNLIWPRGDGLPISLLHPQRNAISPNDFANLAALAERVLGFQNRYNDKATPFDWTYTREDLNAFLRRLDEHDHILTRTGRPDPR